MFVYFEGKPKRLLDPSTGLSGPAPQMPQNSYMYNQPVSNIIVIMSKKKNK